MGTLRKTAFVYMLVLLAAASSRPEDFLDLRELAVTSAQSWVPVVDARFPEVAVAAGALAGCAAGIYPAWVASRLQPTEALRRE